MTTRNMWIIKREKEEKKKSTKKAVMNKKKELSGSLSSVNMIRESVRVETS